MWIGALCINQQDLEERSAQFQMTRDIYRDANKVLVWLGEPNTAHLEQVTGLLDVQEMHSGLETLRGRQRPLWWAGLWIMQEMSVCDSEPLIYLGKWRSCWADFNADLGQVMKQWATRRLGSGKDIGEGAEGDPEYMGHVLPHLQRLQDIRDKHENGTTNLCALAPQASTSDASVRKNKVYGLLGWVPQRESSLDLVDYTTSDAEVFCVSKFATTIARGSLRWPSRCASSEEARPKSTILGSGLRLWN